MAPEELKHLGQGGLALRSAPNRACGVTPFQATEIRFQRKIPRETATQHAKFGSLWGTQFMAPEVLKNLGQGYSEKADVWSPPNPTGVPRS